MEQFVNVIVDIEVVDKRETGVVSTNMEVYGLKKLLERVVGDIVVSEIVTDASTAVAELVRRMKGIIIVMDKTIKIRCGKKLDYFTSSIMF